MFCRADKIASGISTSPSPHGCPQDLRDLSDLSQEQRSRVSSIVQQTGIIAVLEWGNPVFFQPFRQQTVFFLTLSEVFYLSHFQFLESSKTNSLVGWKISHKVVSVKTH